MASNDSYTYAKAGVSIDAANALVKALATEQRLNSFTANVLITFRGGR